MRARPVEAHAALRGVHRFGDAEAQIEEMMAEGERAAPSRRRATRLGSASLSGSTTIWAAAKATRLNALVGFLIASGVPLSR